MRQGFQNNSRLYHVNMPTHTEDQNTAGSDPFRRVFVGEDLHQMAGMQTEHRMKRQNCGNNVPLHQHPIFGRRDQTGSRFEVTNGEAVGSINYPPRTMSPGFHGLTGEGNRALIDRYFVPGEAGSGSSFGFQSYHGNVLSSVSERETLNYPGSDSLGNYTGSPYTPSCSGTRSACKRKSSMNDGMGSSTFRPNVQQRGRDFPLFPEEVSTSRAELAIPPLSSDLVSTIRFPLDDTSYSRDSTQLSQLSRARPFEHLHVGSNRYYGGRSDRLQEVYQTSSIASGRGSPDALTWTSGGALANEHMMLSARSPHEISTINQGTLSSGVVPWCGNGFVSGESDRNHLHVHRNVNTGISMGSQARTVPNGASLWMEGPYLTWNTFEPSSRGSPGFPGRESAPQRSYQASVGPLYSGHILSSHPPAAPLISHNRFNAQGGPLPYYHATTGNMILGSHTAPGSGYSSFGLFNRSALMPPFRGYTESSGASPLHNHYGMPFRGLEMLPAHRGSGQRLPSQELFDHALAWDVQDHHIGLQPDVDNMTYEELLALEESIGNVNTGLSEEKIRKCLKASKHSSYDVTVPVSEESEMKCSICQEEYMEGDELGQLNCNHSYHTDCIKQWLMLKNQCPICKAAALPSP